MDDAAADCKRIALPTHRDGCAMPAAGVVIEIRISGPLT
jgi:hypothetical protein